MLGQSKVGRYFLYAMGEIILVVIGILIALQVNNWNEARSSRVTQHSYLVRLNEDLNSDLNYFIRNDSIYELELLQSRKLVDTFLLEQSASSLKFVMNQLDERLSELVVSRNTYDEMVSTGVLYSIENIDLINEIQEYYNWSNINQYYIKSNNNDLAAYWIKPFYSYLLIADENKTLKQPNYNLDFKSFYDENHQNNIDLRAYLIKYKDISRIKNILFKDQIKYSKILIDKIEKEIKR